MHTLAHDLRLAVRRLRRQPGFTALAVLTLALGLGANTAMFSLTRGTLMRQLPLPRTEELLRLGDDADCCVNSGMPENWSLFSHPLYEHLRDNLPQFASLAAFQAAAPRIGVRRTGTAATESLPSEYVSGNYFTMFEAAPAAGRLLGPDDDRPGAEPAFVISHRAWQRTFGGDPSVIGAGFLVAGHPMTLVGVAAETFVGDSVRLDPAALWIPLAQEPVMRAQTSILARPDQNWLYTIGRARPGASRDEIATTATALVRRWLAEQPFLTDPAREQIDRQVVRIDAAGGGVNRLRFVFARPLAVLFVLAAAVLLIAAANLANLLLARTDAGRVAVQAALGAPAGRLVRQALTEGVLLATVASLLGLGVATLAVRALVALAFPPAAHLPLELSVLDPSVLAFSCLLAVLTGAAFSAVPAWSMARAMPAMALRAGGRGVPARTFVPRRVLVVVQVALSVVLVAGAGLLTQSLRHLERQALGFETDGRLIARIRLPAAPTDLDVLAAYYAALRARLLQVPGVLDVSYSLYSPMQGDNWSSGVSLEGRTADPQGNTSSWNRVGPRYFETLGTRVLRGRSIQERDSAAAPRVAVVNQAFVRRFSPEADPIGRRVGIGGAERAGDFEIVGVTEDVKYTAAHEPTRPMLFLPVLQSPEGLTGTQQSGSLRSMAMGAVVLRAAGGAGSLEVPVRRALAEVDPDLAVQQVQTLSDQVRDNFQVQRLMARLTETYGVLALGLAALGLYAVTAFGVAQRTRDFGVRMALGADGPRILGEVLRSAMGQVVVGLVVGIAAALAATRAVSSLLYGVGARDPGVLVGTALVLLVAAALAALLPARRAAAVDPARALRSE